MYNVCEPGLGDCTAKNIFVVATPAYVDRVCTGSHTKDIPAAYQGRTVTTAHTVQLSIECAGAM